MLSELEVGGMTDKVGAHNFLNDRNDSFCM